MPTLARTRALPGTFVLAALLAGAALAGCGSSAETTGSSGQAPGGGKGGAAAEASSKMRTPRAGRKPSEAPLGAAVESCGGTRPHETTRVLGASCAEARRVVAAWVHTRSCAPGTEASRASCTIGNYGCIAVRTERGIDVNCARAGHSISFIRPS